MFVLPDQRLFPYLPVIGRWYAEENPFTGEELVISMDDFNNNVFGGGNDFNNGGSFSSPFSAPLSHDAEASDTSTQPEVDANEAEVAEAPVVESEAEEETTTRKKPGRKAGRTSGRGSRKTDSSAVPWQVVRKILDAREKLEIVDDSTRKLAASLLGVTDETDETRFVVALLNPEKTEDAKKSLSALLDTYDMNDLEFGMSIGSKTHAERKALYELEEAISPDKAAEVTNGRFPSNSPMEEVSIIRRIQKETNGFKEAITSVSELLG